MPPTFSIVIPTYQRRDVVAGSVRALAAQLTDDFEVIVVVDGSTDGTAEVLRRLTVPFPLTVLEQPNRGAAVARNHGANAADGRVLLFLDDDMEADPGLLHAHQTAYLGGADAVVGDIPLHPDTPRSVLSDGTARWATERANRLARAGGAVTVADVLTGQLSLRREVFDALGRFDEAFTSDGTFGNEDSDLGQRLLDGGYRIVYAPGAISRQRYLVDAGQLLRQSRQLGRADLVYLAKHPAEAGRIRQARRADAVWNRFGWRPLTRRPALAALVGTGLTELVLRLVDRHPRNALVGRLFAVLRDLEYWRGVRGAIDPGTARSLRVLCYHAISDLRDAPVISEYGVPAADLRRQLGLLRRLDVNFVGLDDVLRFLDGTGTLPRRPVLVTFDDCVVDLLDAAVPELQRAAVPAVAFAVAGRTGGTNDWDAPLGAPTLELLDAVGLKSVQSAGVEIGAHGYHHRPLRGVPTAELGVETAEAADELQRLGVERPRAFAYPHGSHDARARGAVAAAGYAAAFTVTPGAVRVGADRFALNRIEVLRSDGSGLRFLIKVAAAGLPLRAQAHRLRNTLRMAGALFRPGGLAKLHARLGGRDSR